VLAAAINAVKAGKMDPSAIMNSSQQLARTLSELVGHTKAHAYLAREGGNLTDTAEKALALDELLTTLATMGATVSATTKPTNVNTSMDSLISSIGNEQLATVAAPILREAAPPPVPEPKQKKKQEGPSQPPVKQVSRTALNQHLFLFFKNFSGMLVNFLVMHNNRARQNRAMQCAIFGY
jgi:hypothetical protein